ncbi:MAG: hypothetical protein ABI878_11945 [Acidobacteriota bacterium]
MSLDKRWEKFRGGPAGGSELSITLNPRGMIYLNEKAYQVFGAPQAVALYYGREDDSIAMEPAYPRFAENFKLVKRETGWCIHASSFFRHFGIRVPVTQRFLRPNLTNEGQFILDLRDTVNTGGIKRTAPRS